MLTGQPKTNVSAAIQDIGSFTIAFGSDVQIRHDLQTLIGQSKAQSCLNPIDLPSYGT